jgi:hypothetical protein
MILTHKDYENLDMFGFDVVNTDGRPCFWSDRIEKLLSAGDAIKIVEEMRLKVIEKINSPTPHIICGVRDGTLAWNIAMAVFKEDWAWREKDPKATAFNLDVFVVQRDLYNDFLDLYEHQSGRKRDDGKINAADAAAGN